MLAVLSCIVIMFVLQAITPYWWWICVVPFVYMMFKGKGFWRSLLIGGVASCLLWLGGSAFYWWTGGEYLMARLSRAVSFSPVWLIVASGTVGLIFGALGGATGYLARISWWRATNKN